MIIMVIVISNMIQYHCDGISYNMWEHTHDTLNILLATGLVSQCSPAWRASLPARPTMPTTTEPGVCPSILSLDFTWVQGCLSHTQDDLSGAGMLPRACSKLAYHALPLPRVCVPATGLPKWLSLKLPCLE